MINKSLFSSKSDEWATPQDLFDELNQEFHFDLDPCATAANAKCKNYIDSFGNGLKADWAGHKVFCNPPYSQIGAWVRKCHDEGVKPGTVVVMLIPSRTDTKYFHDYIYHRSEVRFIRGRLKFGDSRNSAPFPSMIVIFRGAEL